MKKTINRYLVLVTFLLITCMGLAIRYFTDEKSWIWEFWSVLDVSIAVALGVMAFLAYKEFIQSEDVIKIYFNVAGQEKDTGLSLLRKECSRGEILGVLGMMQRKTKERFSLEGKKLPILLKELQEIQKGNEDKIVVDMTQEEFEQYDIEQFQDNDLEIQK